MRSALLLVLALTFDRAGCEHTCCHGDPKPLHSSAYAPVNGSPWPTDCTMSCWALQRCHFFLAHLLKADWQPAAPVRLGLTAQSVTQKLIPIAGFFKNNLSHQHSDNKETIKMAVKYPHIIYSFLNKLVFTMVKMQSSHQSLPVFPF